MQLDFAITLQDIIVFFIAVLYALLVLIIADVARRKLNVGSDFTRKIVHLFAGAAIWTVPYYTHSYVATFVALLFTIFLLMASNERFSKFFSAMARPEDVEHGSVRGPFWYAVSITVLTGIFTFLQLDTIYFVAAASIHMMMFGDGMSAPIGMKYGKNHTITILGSKRSLQGTLALFVFAFFGALLAFWFFGIFNYGTLAPGGNILWTEMLIMAFIGSLAATLIELISPKGTDNILLPYSACVIMIIVGMMLGVVIF
ncbi:MAG: diacylglycerol/polyprenol kinase family protein [Candidatus Thorarchaeota archaeon]|jgi:phytol kinase